MEATDRTLGELIKTMRKAEDITQSELAEAVYSDVSSICRWEHGENISWFKFLEIAYALGCTVAVEVKEVVQSEQVQEQENSRGRSDIRLEEGGKPLSGTPTAGKGGSD